jgi:hypothetical protein
MLYDLKCLLTIYEMDVMDLIGNLSNVRTVFHEFSGRAILKIDIVR